MNQDKEIRQKGGTKEGTRYLPICEELSPAEMQRLTASAIDVFRELIRRSDRPDAETFLLQRADHSSASHTPVETILAIDPFETIRIQRGQAVVRTGDTELRMKGNPFAILADRMERYRALGLPELPSFQGGAFGYFSYDSVRFLEPSLTLVPGNLQRLEEGAKDTKHFDAEFALFRKLVIFDHVRGRVFLISGIFPELESVEDGMTRARAEIQALRQACLAAPATPDHPAIGTHSCPELSTDEMRTLLGKKRFLQSVRVLKSHIRAGDIFQAVLSERFEAPFSGDPLNLFRILSLLSPAPYQFFFSSGRRAFLGASPEMLVQLKDGELETHPIAGTRPRGTTEAQERKLEAQLLRSEKERAEHLMLVDLARNDMGRISQPGTVRVGSFMQLRKFSGVMHLVSRVTGRIRKGVRPMEALGAFFPAGTLSGAPKIRAMQLLSGLEPEARGFYGGAVVAAAFSGDLDSCIAIRSIELRSGVARVQAGAGIVADSRPESEYAEVQHKSRLARKALALASLDAASAGGNENGAEVVLDSIRNGAVL